jgi:isoleucyl-tRNA synthetase
MSKFPELPPTVTALEDEVLERWQAEGTFRQSLEQTAGGTPFVFYEGPPTANGRPGIHHVMSRTLKDAVARFRTMQGRWVPRMAGWDTHGLPVEIEAEKKLGISGKREIEEMGIARFNEVCRESVLTYTDEWQRFSARIGYWLDYSKPYVTYHPDYIESVWWLLKQISERGLFYRGHKILPYCPRCGTGLSSHEVAQGYKDVKDPSLYLTMPVLGDDGAPDGRELLVWTTTPWTLVSNVALAISADEEYVEVAREGRRYILVRGRVAALFGDDAEIVRSYRPDELVGLAYQRPFDWVQPTGFPDEQVRNAWHVYTADFVSSGDGTGIVHISPAFGADDYAIGQSVGLPVLRPVDDRGAFREDLPLVGGKFVKDADTDLLIDLKGRGLVFKSSREEHSYPHCWRCQSPLLYMARDSWFIRTTAVRDQLLANNAQIRWFPPEIGAGRFGEWLENNVDWAISRARYWGTPLPAWVCDRDPSHVHFIGSFAELKEKTGRSELPDPHRPYVDELEWACAECGGTMRRTPEVIDVWFDSGSMPFAQHHFPFENEAEQARQFPAEFISEGVDQTRGWFYSLLAISTLLGKTEPPYRHVIVNDMLLDDKGLKMSKSRGNIVNPWEAIERFGADAIRWYLLSSSNPWLPKRFDAEGVREVQRKTLDTLRQTYRFFAMYASLEGWTPETEAPAVRERSTLDRWLLSELQTLTGLVHENLETYNLTQAVRLIGDFIVDDLSNWYVRRSRERFWGNADSSDTLAAFSTLHEALVTVARLMAPFAPFLSDWLHRALNGDSVHLAEYPTLVEDRIHAQSSLGGMSAVRKLATLGRAAREEAGVRVRQPLGVLYAVTPDTQTSIEGELLEILRDELNVHRIEFMDKAEHLVTYSAKPVFKALGKRFGGRTQVVANAIRELSSEQIAEFLSWGYLMIDVEGTEIPVEEGEIEIIRSATGDFAVGTGEGYVVALDPTITPELRLEGLARELVNRVQNLRKVTGLQVQDRIRLGIFGDGEILDVSRQWGEFVAAETLATELETGSVNDFEGYEASVEVILDGVEGTVAIARVPNKE